MKHHLLLGLGTSSVNFFRVNTFVIIFIVSVKQNKIP